jgi:hypothetical protein
LEDLKETVVCHMGKIEQRRGDYHVEMLAEYLDEIGLFLESEHPSLMCEGRIVDGAARLTWEASQGFLKSVMQRKIANSLEEVLGPRNVGTDNTTPLPVGGGNFAGGYLAPDVSGFVRRPTEVQGLKPFAEKAPWPQVWVEVAFTDSGEDYKNAISKIQNCVRDVREPCVYVLVALQNTASRILKERMARGNMDLAAPSVEAEATIEPTNAPKVAVWQPDLAPSWYVLETNKYVKVPIPMTDPQKEWRFDFNLVCQCYEP